MANARDVNEVAAPGPRGAGDGGLLQRIRTNHWPLHDDRGVPGRPVPDEWLAVEVTVERVDLTGAVEVVVVCRRKGVRQRIPVLDLPMPTPPPDGWEWIEAYRYWARGGP